MDDIFTEQFPVLSTERLHMRQIGPGDLIPVFKALSDQEVIKYYGGFCSNLTEAQIQIDWYNQIRVEETGMWWAISYKDAEILLGAIGLYEWNKDHKRIEIGCWLLPEYWGLGIIKEAGKVVCDYAFKNLGIHRVEAFVETENEKSKKILQYMGFAYEGTMKDCVFRNNKFANLEIYAKLAI